MKLNYDHGSIRELITYRVIPFVSIMYCSRTVQIFACYTREKFQKIYHCEKVAWLYRLGEKKKENGIKNCTLHKRIETEKQKCTNRGRAMIRYHIYWFFFFFFGLSQTKNDWETIAINTKSNFRRHLKTGRGGGRRGFPFSVRDGPGRPSRPSRRIKCEITAEFILDGWRCER